MLFSSILKKFDIERIIHSIKTSVACILGFALTKLVGFSAGQWIIITIIVVMCAQIFVGSVVQKAYSRFLGTIVGCLLAAISLMILGHTSISIAITIGLSSLIFSYIATGQESLSYAGTLGAATTAIILLNQNPTLTLAAERFLEISIGLFIAAIVSQFILPIHARTHLRRTQVATFEQLREYYKLIMSSSPDNEITDFPDLDEQIAKRLIKQRQLAKESSRERGGIVFDAAHFIQSLYCEREILRSMNYMHNALINIKKITDEFLAISSLNIFNQAIIESLRAIEQAIQASESSLKPIHIPSLEMLKDDLEKSTLTYSRDELIYINGFLFSAEILVNSLIKLVALYRIPLDNNVIA